MHHVAAISVCSTW